MVRKKKVGFRTDGVFGNVTIDSIFISCHALWLILYWKKKSMRITYVNGFYSKRWDISRSKYASDISCIDLFRMSIRAFMKLCGMLQMSHLNKSVRQPPWLYHVNLFGRSQRVLWRSLVGRYFTIWAVRQGCVPALRNLLSYGRDFHARLRRAPTLFLML